MSDGDARTDGVGRALPPCSGRSSRWTRLGHRRGRRRGPSRRRGSLFRVSRGHGERAVPPAEQVGVEGRDQPDDVSARRGPPRPGAECPARRPRQLVSEVLEGLPSGSRTEAGPRCEVIWAGRRVRDEVSPGKLGLVASVIASPGDPVVEQDERVLAGAPRTETREAGQRGEPEEVVRRLPIQLHASRPQPLGGLAAGQRAVRKDPFEVPDRLVGFVHAELGETPARSGQLAGSEDPREPSDVLAKHEVQGSAHRPGAYDRTILLARVAHVCVCRVPGSGS
jgi:hypothetical protein